MTQIGEKGMINLISREDLNVSLESCYSGRISHGGGMFGSRYGCVDVMDLSSIFFSFSRVPPTPPPPTLHTTQYLFLAKVLSQASRPNSNLTSTLGSISTISSRPFSKFQVPTVHQSFPTISHAHILRSTPSDSRHLHPPASKPDVART